MKTNTTSKKIKESLVSFSKEKGVTQAEIANSVLEGQKEENKETANSGRGTGSRNTSRGSQNERDSQKRTISSASPRKQILLQEVVGKEAQPSNDSGQKN